MKVKGQVFTRGGGLNAVGGEGGSGRPGGVRQGQHPPLVGLCLEGVARHHVGGAEDPLFRESKIMSSFRETDEDYNADFLIVCLFVCPGSAWTACFLMNSC